MNVETEAKIVDNVAWILTICIFIGIILGIDALINYVLGV